MCKLMAENGIQKCRIDFWALLISIISLLLSVFPQLNPFNDNLIEKANAGDIDSQMFLADLYYEIGNTGESVQWYSIASSHGGNHQATAINNLAYIYLTYDCFDITRQSNEYDAMKMFRVAAELGEIDAAKNLYLLLISNPRELFGDSYSETIEFAREELLENGTPLDSLDEYYTQWELLDTDINEFIPEDDAEYKVKPVKSELIMQNGYPAWVHTYEVYRKLDDVDDPEYIYIKIK